MKHTFDEPTMQAAIDAATQDADTASKSIVTRKNYPNTWRDESKARLDHLRAIDAHLTSLLALTAKRTPGEWKACHGKHGTIIRLSKDTIGEPMDVCRAWNCSRKDGNAAFIASCAGNAEAGWRATKAAIAILIECNPTGYTGSPSSQLLESILAEWPIELITKRQ